MATNGRLPKRDLARVYHPTLDLYLEKDAAAAWNTMRMTSRRWLRIDVYPGGPDSAYRTVARQKYWRDYWCGQGACENAAPVGSSNHGWGLAVDLPTRRMRYAVDRVGARFGWAKKWSDAPHEWWHLKYASGKWKRPDPGTDIRNPIVREGSGGTGQSWAVKNAQKLLVRHGCLKRNNVTGSFGRATDEGVKRFQRTCGLKADGVVGAKTWAALRRKSSPRVTKPSAKPKPKATKPATATSKPKPKAKAKAKATKPKPKSKPKKKESK